MILPLTTDLDKVSQELFALTTNGGEEYCGAVIQQAVNNLSWSKNPGDLKAIFIAGNEPFSQGRIDFRSALKIAISRDVVVNTIFCGNHDEGVNTHWKEGAALGYGSYMSIDQNHVVTHIAAPQDDEIARLGVALNQTYLPYGKKGAAFFENQAAQDKNAERTGEGLMVARATAKASIHYKNSGWDLVEAVSESLVDLKKIQKDDLPESMREMPVSEQQVFLAEKAKERKKIQKRIQQLSLERKKYVALKKKEEATSQESTFDSAVIECILRLAKEKNFTTEKP
jgi:hypothetical protein